MIKEQLKKLKENWLLIVLFLVVLFFVSGTSSSTFDMVGVSSNGMYVKSMGAPMAVQESMMYDSGFAPEVSERKIVGTVSMSTEVKRGDFNEMEAQLKSIVTSTNSFLLNENVQIYDKTKSGNYQIKVETSKSDAVVTQLKNIGEIQSFSVGKNDITEYYESLEIQLNAEKSRLQKFQQMYADAKEINDKIVLTNNIFDLERTIKNLEEQIKNQDNRVDYTTIYFNMQEESSGYVYIALVKFSELVKGLVDSFNTLLMLIFVVLPYAVVALISWFVWRKFKK